MHYQIGCKVNRPQSSSCYLNAMLCNNYMSKVKVSTKVQPTAYALKSIVVLWGLVLQLNLNLTSMLSLLTDICFRFLMASQRRVSGHRRPVVHCNYFL